VLLKAAVFWPKISFKPETLNDKIHYPHPPKLSHEFAETSKISLATMQVSTVSIIESLAFALAIRMPTIAEFS
jgi:hypothetical protein